MKFSKRTLTLGLLTAVSAAATVVATGLESDIDNNVIDAIEYITDGVDTISDAVGGEEL